MTCIVCLIISLIQKVNCIIQNFQPFASLSFSWFTCNQKSPLIEEKPKTMRLLIKMIVGPQLHGMMKQQQKRGNDDDDTNQVTWLSFTVIFFVFLPFASIHFHHTNGTITHSSFTRETQSSVGLDVLKYQPQTKRQKKIQQKFKKRGELF